MIRVLRVRRFAALFDSQVSSLVATGLLTVAIALVAVDLDAAQASAVIATALTIRIAVYVVVSPIATALLAGRSSRAVLIAADAMRMLVAIALVTVTAPWQLFVGIALLQLASAVFTPTYQAVIPRVLPDERDYTAAQSLSRLAYDLESLVSPPLAAVLVMIVPTTALFAVTGAGFVLSAVAVVAAGTLGLVGASGEPFRRRLSAGMRTLARTAGPRFAAVLDGATATVYATVLVLTVVLVGEATPGDPATPLAVALVAFGLGSIALALSLGALLRRASDVRVMRAGAVLSVVALGSTAAIAASGNLSVPAIAVVWFSLGVASSAISTPSARFIRREVPAEGHAAVFAARFSTSHAWYALTYPVAGGVAALASPVTALVALATIAAACAVATIPMEVMGRRD